MSFCSKEMVNLVGEALKYTKIKNDVFKLLDEITKKMFDPGLSKYPYVALTDQIECIL